MELSEIMNDLGVEFTGGGRLRDNDTSVADEDDDRNVNEFLIVTKVSRNGLAYGKLK